MELLREGVRPRSTASRASSRILKRESGTFCAVGSSQAIAFTSTTSCGGKTSGASAAGLVCESFEAVQVEAFSPGADYLPGHVELLADDLVLKPFSGEQDKLGTNDLGVGRCVAASGGFEMLPFVFGEDDDVWARPGHVHLSQGVR